MLLLVLLLFNHLHAKEILSFDACVQAVLQNNAELEMSRSDVRRADFNLLSSRNNFVPKFSANLSKNIEKITSDGMISGTSQGLSASLNGSFNLFNGMRDFNTYEQTYFLKKSSEENLKQTKASLSAELKIAFENLLYAKELKKLSNEIAKRREENLKLVQLRYQGGLENKGSALLSKAYFSQAQYDDLQAQNGITTARARLAKVLGFDNYHDFDIAGEVPVLENLTQNLAKNEMPNFFEIVETIPTYKRIMAQVDASRKAMAIAKSNFYPKIELTGSLRKNGASFFPNERESASLGIVLNIPLFDGGRDYYGHKASTEEWIRAQSEKINMKRDLMLKLEQQFSRLKESYSKFKVDKNFRDATIVRAEIARNKYNNGLLSFENWDIIENDLIARQRAFLMSKRDMINAQALWEEIRGVGLIP